MQIRYGFDVALDLAQPATIFAMMDVHSDLRRCIAEETELEVAPTIATERFVDDSGNIVRRLSAPAGPVSLSLQGVFRSDRPEDEVDSAAEAIAAPDLRPDALPFLRPSRYCETDLLADFAWANFGAISGGWARVQAICDFVHQRLKFSYAHARPTRTASEALAEGVGVCRDFTHLAVALCRCLNIPAR
jgi:transglutaminase-like putative cysteine protease